MSDFIKIRVQELCDKHKLHQENLVIEVLKEYLGRDDWTFEEMKDRCNWVSLIDKPDERTLTCDGVPLLFVGGLEIVNLKDQCKIKIQLKYKKLRGVINESNITYRNNRKQRFF